MRKYYVLHGRFGNEYTLAWADSADILPESWERITRKEAVELAREEARRAKYDPAFSGFASSTIWPYAAVEGEMYMDPYAFTIRDRIATPIRKGGKTNAGM